MMALPKIASECFIFQTLQNVFHKYDRINNIKLQIIR